MKDHKRNRRRKEAIKHDYLAGYAANERVFAGFAAQEMQHLPHWPDSPLEHSENGLGIEEWEHFNFEQDDF